MTTIDLSNDEEFERDVYEAWVAVKRLRDCWPERFGTDVDEILGKASRHLAVRYFTGHELLENDSQLQGEG